MASVIAPARIRVRALSRPGLARREPAGPAPAAISGTSVRAAFDDRPDAVVDPAGHLVHRPGVEEVAVHRVSGTGREPEVRRVAVYRVPHDLAQLRHDHRVAGRA